jgi:hypothetical protein
MVKSSNTQKNKQQIKRYKTFTNYRKDSQGQTSESTSMSDSYSPGASSAQARGSCRRAGGRSNHNLQVAATIPTEGFRRSGESSEETS